MTNIGDVNTHSPLVTAAPFHRYGIVEITAATGYPGDSSFGLPPSDQGAFDHTYLVHLGDDLDTESRAVAAAEVSEYLYLNAASPVGRFFDAIRSSDSADSGSRRETSLRTFGLIQFDPHHNEVTSLAVEELSRGVVAQWLGGDKFFEDQPVEEYLKKEFPDLEGIFGEPDPKSRKRRPKDADIAGHRTGLQYLLDPEALRGVLSSAIQQQLGGDGDHIFRKWIKLASPRGLAEKRVFLRELDRSLGPHRRAGEDSDLPLSELEQRLAVTSAELAVMAIESIRDVLLRLTSDPHARIAGAQTAAQWLCDRLRQFERATSTEWTRIEERLTALESSLPEKVTAGGTGLFGRRSKRGETWCDYCQLRAHIIVTESVARFVRRVNTYLSDYREQLKNAQFSLSRVASQFASQHEWTDAIASSRVEESEKKSLCQAIGRLIEAHMPKMVAQLDQSLGDELIRLDSSLPIEEKEQPNVQRFARALRAKSWSVLSKALTELDLPRRMFGQGKQSVASIADCLTSAVPRLPMSGGEKRLLVVAPRASEESVVRHGLKQCEDGQFSLVQAGESQLVFCYELRDLSLPIMASRLAEYRENCILAAGRLHTRIDVSWPDRMTW